MPCKKEKKTTEKLKLKYKNTLSRVKYKYLQGQK